MKKIYLSTLLSMSLFAGQTIVPPNEKFKINTPDLMFQYDYQGKKCGPTDFEFRQTVVNAVRAENAIISEKYENRVGTTYLINYEFKGEEYRIALMDSFGECRLFEDILIKHLDVNPDNYKNLKLAK